MSAECGKGRGDRSEGTLAGGCAPHTVMGRLEAGGTPHHGPAVWIAGFTGIWGSGPEATLTSWVGQARMVVAPLYPPGLGYRDSWTGFSPRPALSPRINRPFFFFQILGGVILGFGVWILADRSSFISVLRKEPSLPLPCRPWRGGPSAGRADPQGLQLQSCRSLSQLTSGPAQSCR